MLFRLGTFQYACVYIVFDLFFQKKVVHTSLYIHPIYMPTQKLLITLILYHFYTHNMHTYIHRRNSLKARPPPMKKNDPYYPGNDRRYDDLTEDQLSTTESLLDCMQRARPLWEYGIRKEIKKGNTVLVVAHTNTLRSLMQVIDSKFFVHLF